MSKTFSVSAQSGRPFLLIDLKMHRHSGIAASIASLVQRVIITNTHDTSWIAAILSMCR